MWIWRKMEKISWTAKVSNSEVLNWVNENRCIISTISQRKCRWRGHVLRHDVLLRDVLEGRMTGKRTRGRKRLQLMSNICEGYEIAKKRAEDRCLWCVSVMGVIDLLLQHNTSRRRRRRPWKPPVDARISAISLVQPELKPILCPNVISWLTWQQGSVLGKYQWHYYIKYPVHERPIFFCANTLHLSLTMPELYSHLKSPQSIML